MARTQIYITATDATFEERRRARLMRRGEKHERERRTEAALGALGIAAPIVLGVVACHLYSLWALGVLRIG